MKFIRGAATAAMEKMAVAALLIARIAPAMFDLSDLFWMGGLAAIGYGIAQIYAPAAWIVCGAAVFWMGVRR